MRTRHIASTAALFTAAVSLSLTACGPSREQPDSGIPDAGCFPPHCFVGGGNKDAGTDGGVHDPSDGGNPDHDGGNVDPDGGTDAGFVYDGGLLDVTLRDLRGPNIPFGANVRVTGVVVHTVSYSAMGTGGDYRADFWVSDPNDPPCGMWISKFYTDAPGPYLPQPGDVLTINGYFGTVSKFTNPTGYRREIAAKKVGTSFLPITIEKTDAGAIPDPIIVTPGQFGDADGGWARPNPDHAGSRIYIQGPIEITNPSPAAMHRVSANPDDPVYYGFEVTGGILINDSKTFAADGGCPWRDIALDAGVNGQKVVFTQGIYGVYDTFTVASCVDGGTNLFNCFNNPGQVPGTTNDYTYVVYPQSCADFAGGEVRPQ